MRNAIEVMDVQTTRYKIINYEDVIYSKGNTVNSNFYMEYIL